MSCFSLNSVSKPFSEHLCGSALRWAAALALALFSLSSFASSLDRLQRPALMSPLAERSLLLDLAVADSLLVAVGERGHILRSEDGGVHWQQAEVPVSVTLTAVHLVDSQYGWAVGHDGVVLATSDGGRRWSLLLEGRRVNELVVNHYQALVERAESGQDDALDADTLLMQLDDALFSRDEGPTKPFLDLYFADRRRGWVVGAYGLFLRTEDGGRSWLPAMSALDNPDSFHLNSISQRDGRLLIAGEAGVLFRSDDGEVWQRLELGYEGPLFSVVGVSDKDGLLLSGLRGRLFISRDGGDQWQALETATRSTINTAVALSDGGVLAVGNGGAILRADAALAGFSVHMQAGRESYTAVVETAPGQLVLVGQKGVTRTSVEQLTGVSHE